MSRRNPATGGLTSSTFVEALGKEMRKSWPTIRFIACLERGRDHVRGGRIIRTERETIYLITSLPGATPKRIMSVNRSHWRIEAMHCDKIEAMHCDKDVTPDEDRHTNRLDHAPQNIFTLTSATRTMLRRVSNSPTRAIEAFQTAEQRRPASCQRPQQFLLNHPATVQPSPHKMMNVVFDEVPFAFQNQYRIGDFVASLRNPSFERGPAMRGIGWESVGSRL